MKGKRITVTEGIKETMQDNGGANERTVYVMTNTVTRATVECTRAYLPQWLARGFVPAAIVKITRDLMS